MKIAEDLAYMLVGAIEGASDKTLVDPDGVALMLTELIESRDAEIHALYKDVVKEAQWLAFGWPALFETSSNNKLRGWPNRVMKTLAAIEKANRGEL